MIWTQFGLWYEYANIWRMNMHAAGVDRRQGRLQDRERCNQVDWIYSAGQHLLESCRRRHPPGESNLNYNFPRPGQGRFIHRPGSRQMAILAV